MGYGESANEWIPEESLNCPQRLAEFQLEEASKKKKQRSRRERDRIHSKKRRTSKKPKRSKKRRVNIIEDDENEEEENNQEEKSVESSKSSTEKSEKDSETNPAITYGVEKGYQVQAILGINRSKGDQLHYLVHYKSPTIFDDNMELIPSDIAKKHCEDELIQFYETRITWNEHQND